MSSVNTIKQNQKLFKGLQARIVTTDRKVAVVVGDEVVGRWPNIKAGVRMARLASIRVENPQLAEKVLDRVFETPAEADAIIQGTLDYLAGLKTSPADAIETWLNDQRTKCALVVAVKKYGYGSTSNLTDPVLWIQKAGETRHEYEAGQRPTFHQLDLWLESEGYVPVDEAATGFKRIEVHPTMIVRRYSREAGRA